MQSLPNNMPFLHSKLPAAPILQRWAWLKFRQAWPILLQGVKSWRQAVDSPTTAWIRDASSPVNSISSALAPSAASAGAARNKSARDRSSSPVHRGPPHSTSNPAPHAGPSRFSPAQSHALVQGHSPVMSQQSRNVAASGAWGAGPPKNTRPGLIPSPRGHALQQRLTANETVSSGQSGTASVQSKPGADTKLPGSSVWAASQEGSGNSVRRPPMHPQAHALASTGSSRPSSQRQQGSPTAPPRPFQSAGNSSNGSCSAADDMKDAGVGAAMQPAGSGMGQALLLGSPHSSTSSCSVTFSKADGLVSPGSTAQPRSAPPTPSAHRGPTHRPNTPAKKRLSLVPTPIPPSASISCVTVRPSSQEPSNQETDGPLEHSVAISSERDAAKALLCDGKDVSQQQPAAASHGEASEGPIPLCTPMKAPVRRASWQDDSLPDARSAASSVEAQASSTEATAEESQVEMPGQSPDQPSPGDASSPGIQFPARPVLGQSTSMVQHHDDSSAQHDDSTASWSAPSLSHALEAAAAAADAQAAPEAASKEHMENSQLHGVEDQHDLAGVVMAPEAYQLVEAYGAALAHSQHVSLAAEMELLLYLLAVPAGVGGSPKPMGHGVALPHSAAAADEKHAAESEQAFSRGECGTDVLLPQPADASGEKHSTASPDSQQASSDQTGKCRAGFLRSQPATAAVEKDAAVAPGSDFSQLLQSNGPVAEKLQTGKLLQTGRHAHLFACCVLKLSGGSNSDWHRTGISICEHPMVAALHAAVSGFVWCGSGQQPFARVLLHLSGET